MNPSYIQIEPFQMELKIEYDPSRYLVTDIDPIPIILSYNNQNYDALIEPTPGNDNYALIRFLNLYPNDFPSELINWPILVDSKHYESMLSELKADTVRKKSIVSTEPITYVTVLFSHTMTIISVTSEKGFKHDPTYYHDDITRLQSDFNLAKSLGISVETLVNALDYERNTPVVLDQKSLTELKHYLDMFITSRIFTSVPSVSAKIIYNEAVYILSITKSITKPVAGIVYTYKYCLYNATSKVLLTSENFNSISPSIHRELLYWKSLELIKIMEMVESVTQKPNSINTELEVLRLFVNQYKIGM